jgi:hypothetical protein
VKNPGVLLQKTKKRRRRRRGAEMVVRNVH